jgi:hypothetical protein
MIIHTPAPSAMHYPASASSYRSQCESRRRHIATCHPTGDALSSHLQYGSATKYSVNGWRKFNKSWDRAKRGLFRAFGGYYGMWGTMTRGDSIARHQAGLCGHFMRAVLDCETPGTSGIVDSIDVNLIDPLQPSETARSSLWVQEDHGNRGRRTEGTKMQICYLRDEQN